jgi:oligopeptide transport system ATP-binding protein
MNPEVLPPVELTTVWEAVFQPLLWYVVPNLLLNLMVGFWLLGELRNRRRLGEPVAVRPWVLFSFLIGLVWPAVTGPLAYRAASDCRRRGHSPRFWVGVVSLLSFIGYYSYRVYDDADGRRMRAGVWSFAAGAWYLALLAGLPLAAAQSVWLRTRVFIPSQLLWLLPAVLLAIAFFPLLYAAARRPLRFEDVKNRWGRAAGPDAGAPVLLSVENLKTYFPLRGGVFSTVRGYVKAVDDVSFHVKRGEVLGLVGESGCGKTTVGRTVLGLLPATAGRVRMDGVDLAVLNNAEMAAIRSRMQVIFQDPIGSLNPRMTVGAIIREGLDIHRIGSRAERQKTVNALVERVGLSPDVLNRYPHEFSGGQRQRIGIARALALGADFIICDEPVSALDVSIQAQIINLMRSLQREFNMSYLFVAHDLAVVEHISDRVAVMYLGKIVEIAGRDELYARPLHPYTAALMASIPTPDPAVKAKAPPLSGDLPSPVNPPSGCRFRTRCPRAIPACAEREPPMTDYGNGHQAACLRIGEPAGAPPDRS